MINLTFVITVHLKSEIKFGTSVSSNIKSFLHALEIKLVLINRKYMLGRLSLFEITRKHIKSLFFEN